MDGEQGLILIQDSLRIQGLCTKRLEGRWWGLGGWGSTEGGGGGGAFGALVTNLKEDEGCD